MLESQQKHLDSMIGYDKANKALVSAALSSFVDELRHAPSDVERSQIAQKVRHDYRVSGNNFEKSTCLLKMLYINMYSIDISWSHFEATKLLGDENYSIKRRCYLFMENCFMPKTDASIMCTNMLLKDIKYDEKIIPLTMNTLSLLMTQDVSQIVFESIKIHSLHACSEVKLKSTVMIISVARSNNIYPNEHILKLASAISISDDVSKLYVFISVLMELISLFPNIQVPFAPALLKIMRSRLSDTVLVAKLFKVFKRLCKQDLKLLSKIEAFIAEYLKECSNTEIFNEIMEFVFEYPEEFKSNEINELILTSFARLLETTEPNEKFILLKLLNCYVHFMPKFFIDECTNHDEIQIENRDESTIRLKSIVDKIGNKVSACMKSTDRPIIIEAIKYTTKTVNQRNVFNVVNGMVENVKATKSMTVAKVIFEQIIYLCTVNNYQNLMKKPELFEWFVVILIESANLEKIFDYKRIFEELNAILTNYPEISPKLIGHFEDMINHFKLEQNQVPKLSSLLSEFDKNGDRIEFIANVIELVTQFCSELKSITRLSQSILQLAPKATNFPHALTLIKLSLLKICTFADETFANKPNMSHLVALKDAILDEYDKIMQKARKNVLNPHHFNLKFACESGLLKYSNLSEVNSDQTECEIEMPAFLIEYHQESNIENKEKDNCSPTQNTVRPKECNFLREIQANGNLLSPISKNTSKHNENISYGLTTNNPHISAGNMTTKQNNPQNSSLNNTFEKLIIKEKENKTKDISAAEAELENDNNSLNGTEGLEMSIEDL